MEIKELKLEIKELIEIMQEALENNCDVLDVNDYGTLDVLRIKLDTNCQ